jgi:serine/threonine protein kinase
MNNKINIDNIPKFGTKYKILQQIGEGSFGSVWKIMHLKSNKDYAVKIEEKNSKSRLEYEYKVYKTLISKEVKVHVPKIKEYFETNENCCLIMELLGNSLDQMLNDSSKPFNIGTVLKIGIQIVTLLEKIHDAGYLHRDIKPNNFLIGPENSNDKIYIMDFGLSKKYINNDNTHISFHLDRSLIGTVRYASLNVHQGFEPSRRDDLESVGYMLIYLLKKKLPWQGLKKTKDKDQTKMIGECKMKTSLALLCDKLPSCFLEYLKYCRGLKFEEDPDYDYLRNLFYISANQHNIKIKFEWEN